MVHITKWQFEKEFSNTQIIYCILQSYEMKSPPWTIIWWFRILGIFIVENINRSGEFMFQTSDNSQLCIDSQHSSQQLTFVWSLKHQVSQPIYIFNRVRVLHLDRLKEGTWLYSFGILNCDSRVAVVHLMKSWLKCKKFVFSNVFLSRTWQVQTRLIMQE